MTTIWEVRAADGQLDELLAWVRWRANDQVQLYRSAGGEPRLVVVDPTHEVAAKLSDPPAHLVTRRPHAWDFDLVGNA